jgi:hypothetical protein
VSDRTRLVVLATILAVGEFGLGLMLGLTIGGVFQ